MIWLLGTPTGFSVPLEMRQVSHHFPPRYRWYLPKRHHCRRSSFHLSSRSNGRGGGGINSCQHFLRVHNFDSYGASIQQSARVSQFVPWTFLKGLQQAKNARSARCDECLSAGVYGFSSPAVKPGHGFMISSLMLEFVYLETDGIAVRSRILVNNPSGYACGGHFGVGALNAQTFR